MSDMIPAWVDGVLQPFDKLQTHLDGLRHKAVSVFVVRDDKILIQQRALEKYHTPGLWANTCCTHPHWDEDSVTCANRRLEQELGITGLVPEYRNQVEYRADVGGGMIEHEIVDIFVAHASNSLEVTPNASEVMDIAWVSFPDLVAQVGEEPEKFTPWLLIYLEHHAAAIFKP